MKGFSTGLKNLKTVWVPAESKNRPLSSYKSCYRFSQRTRSLYH